MTQRRRWVDVGFRYVYKDNNFTVFFGRGGRRANGAAHAAPVGTIGFPLVWQGIPVEAACARMGSARAGPLPQACLLMRLISFTKGFGVPGFTVFGGFFFDTRNLHFSKVL